MSKFKVKLKVTGLELEIEGSREDAAMLSRNVSTQLSSLMRPVDGITAGSNFDANEGQLIEHEARPNKLRKRRPSVPREASRDGEIAFEYNQEVHGLPNQQWKTAEKALWLLYILDKYTEHKELSSNKIAGVFNKHLRQFGTITISNVWQLYPLQTTAT